MANLLLHCGSRAVDRAALACVATPAATQSWQPIPHLELVETVESALTTNGLRLVNQAHGMTHDNARYFGLMEITNGESVNPEYVRVLGLRNSHDMRLTAGMVAGSQVMVCDNLAFSGEIQISRKHTVNILRDLPGMVRQAIDRLLGAWHRQDRQILQYKDAQLSDKDAHDLIVRSMDAGAFCAKRIPAILGEWREPKHQAFAPRNVWSWFNAVTENLKDNLPMLPRRTQALHSVCDQYVGVS